MSPNDKELLDLLAKLSLSEDQMRATIGDIRRGDDLINRHDQVEVDPAILAQVEARVREELIQTGGKQVGYSWPLRAAAIAASLIIALGLTIYWLQPQGMNTQGTEEMSLVSFEADDYLSVAWQEDVVDREVDDMVFSEVLDYCSANDWDMDDLFGPGSDEDVDSNNLIEISHGDWIGHLVC